MFLEVRQSTQKQVALVLEVWSIVVAYKSNSH